MKRYLRPLTLALVFSLLAAGVYAASSEDSLVSLTYLQDAFLPKAVQQGESAADEMLREVYDKALSQLEAVHGGASSGEGGAVVSSENLGRRLWTDGQSITLITGNSFLMLEGSAVVEHSGVVVDVTGGTEIASGAKLSANHRYLVGEETAAVVTVHSGRAALGVQGVYTLANGKEKHTPFFDVSQSDWFYSQVGYVYEKGLFSGVDGGHFSPSTSMDRAMLMSVLYRLAGSPAQTGETPFSDVPEGTWYTQAVGWGCAQGITSGTGNGTFSPTGGVTREQTVVMLYNYASKYLNKDVSAEADLSGYQDLSQVSQWARPAMGWAVQQGIVSGAANGGKLSLEPGRGASRAEMAVMLQAFCEKIL